MTQEILDAARDVLGRAASWGDVEAEQADAIADATVAALLPWLRFDVPDGSRQQLRREIDEAVREAINDSGHPQSVDPVGDACEEILAALDTYVAGFRPGPT